MNRVGWAALTLAALAGWQAAAEQDVDIRYVWKSGAAPTLIHANGACRDGFTTELLCGDVDADDLWEDIQEVHEQLGVTVGDSRGLLTVNVYEKGHEDEPDNYGAYDPGIDGGIEPSHDWMESDGLAPPAVVHHETGHAVFDEGVGTKSCEGASCTESVVEHWGLDEGFAMVVQQEIGDGYIPPPAGDTVDEIMEGCDIKAAPKGGQKCAHALGRLLVDTFDEYAAKLQEDGMSETAARAKALEVYTAAVADFENQDNNSSPATFLEFMANLVIQVAADPDPDPDHVAAVFEVFRDIGETLPLPRVVSADEQVPGATSPGTPIRPAPWWFGNPALFACRMAIGSYVVTCTRRSNEE